MTHDEANAIRLISAWVSNHPQLEIRENPLSATVESLLADARRYQTLRDECVHEGRIRFFVDADHTIAFDSFIHEPRHLDSAVDAFKKQK